MRSAIILIVSTLLFSAGCDRLSSQAVVIPKIESLSSADKVLSKALRVEVRTYSTYDFGREKDNRSVSFILSEERALKVLPVLRASLGSDLVAFIGTSQWLGQEKHTGVEIVVANGKSQFDILRIARSDAVNYDMLTEDIIKRLQEYDGKYGIDIFQAETDTIRFRLKSLPGNMKEFSEDLYEFCPDIVDQGAGSVDALTREISGNRMVYLWWD